MPASVAFRNGVRPQAPTLRRRKSSASPSQRAALHVSSRSRPIQRRRCMGRYATGMAEPPEEPTRGREWRAALGWFAVALALRLLFLGRFSLWGDEDYSLDDALRWGTTHLRPNQLVYPLFFLLERAALEIGGFVDVVHPDPRRMQWWLRIVPALAGAAAAAP